MIRTVAEILSAVLRAQLPTLDASRIRHAPTIGDMYEGLSATILELAIPDSADLQVCTGFVTDGHDELSRQLDCMIVRGDGAKVPFTDSSVYHVRDVIAVVEVKKRLHRTELADAFDQLNSVRAVEQSYRRIAAEASPNELVDMRPALRAFAETTGKIAPHYGEAIQLPVHEKMILDVLLTEKTSILRVVLGLHGYKSERAFRRAICDFLRSRVGIAGYGPGSFPQLIVSGNYSLVKANGRPYSAPLVDGDWPFCFSTPVNPLLLLLELLWTKLSEVYDLPYLWGEDLDIEVARTLLIARGAEEEGGRRGWHIAYVDPSTSELSAIETEEPWSPAFLTMAAFVVIQRLCAGVTVQFDEPALLNWLSEEGVEAAGLRAELLSTRLVALSGEEMLLITSMCGSAILPTGEFVAGEDNTGRFSRWLARRLDATEASSDVLRRQLREDAG